jgi:glyoxylase-like metal-dependent hydrolase (beta-lactamase superfamily II)
MTGDGNNTWLIDEGEPTLVDAGVGAAAHVDAIVRALAAVHWRVIVTHGHADRCRRRPGAVIAGRTSRPAMAA